jgi:hypothetical protein
MRDVRHSWSRHGSVFGGLVGASGGNDGGAGRVGGNGRDGGAPAGRSKSLDMTPTSFLNGATKAVEGPRAISAIQSRPAALRACGEASRSRACRFTTAESRQAFARISDSIVSHWLLYWLGYRPNPGIQSTPLYVGEAVFLLAAFWPGLALAQATAWVGFVLGIGFFVAILPILRAGRLIKTWRRDAWVRGKPIPAWATLT